MRRVNWRELSPTAICVAPFSAWTMPALEDLKSEEIMTRNPVVVSADTLAYDALRLMEDRPSQISVLPVVDGARVCVGLIRLHDIVRSGL